MPLLCPHEKVLIDSENEGNDTQREHRAVHYIYMADVAHDRHTHTHAHTSTYKEKACARDNDAHGQHEGNDAQREHRNVHHHEEHQRARFLCN